MKKGYWVVAYRSISDASAVKAYGALAVPAVQSFGGRFLTMSASQMQVHEAGLQQPTVQVKLSLVVLVPSVTVTVTGYGLGQESHAQENHRVPSAGGSKGRLDLAGGAGRGASRLPWESIWARPRRSA